MNPQEPGGQPPHQFQEPQVPAGTMPQTPQQQGWAQPQGPQPQASGTSIKPEKHYGQPGPHEAVQQYDFILNPEKPAKKSLLASNGNSPLSRIAIVVGGLVVLIIAAALVMSLLGGKSTSVTGMTTVAQDQTELVRVASLANSQTTGQDVANVAVNTTLSIGSAKQQLLTYMADNGHKLDNKELNLKRDPRTDTQLKTAAAASNFDSTFVSVIQAQLNTYQRDLKIAYKGTSGPKGKALLSSQYDAAGLLLKQLKQ